MGIFWVLVIIYLLGVGIAFGALEVFMQFVDGISFGTLATVSHGKIIVGSLLWPLWVLYGIVKKFSKTIWQLAKKPS